MSGTGKDAGARIRSALVCCDIYDRIMREAARKESRVHPWGYGIRSSVAQAIIHGEWHEMCYYAEVAARIAEGRSDGSEITEGHVPSLYAESEGTATTAPVRTSGNPGREDLPAGTGACGPERARDMGNPKLAPAHKEP